MRERSVHHPKYLNNLSTPDLLALAAEVCEVEQHRFEDRSRTELIHTILCRQARDAEERALWLAELAWCYGNGSEPMP